MKWEFDTAQSFATVSGAVAHGGSMGSDGVVVRDGVVAVNSGHLAPGMPGHVLLVFAADAP